MHTRTTTQLISDLQNPGNADAWSGFDSRYRPVLLAFARKLGFTDDDAAELAQQTLAEFARSYQAGRYVRGQGRLSSWLIGIAQNVGSAMRRKRAAGVNISGDSVLGQVPAGPAAELQMTQVWAKERELAIFAEAMTMLRESARTEANTILAFELFAVRGVPAQEVATQCAITVESVYVIKNRLTKRLREIVAEITAAYDEGE